MFIELNDLPQLIQEGKLSNKEAINYLAEFIHKNPAVFGLEKESPDFRNDLIIDLLEKGDRFLQAYNPDAGKFFPFFYATVKGRIKAIRKKECRLNIHESCIFEELIQNLSYEGTKYIGYREIKPVEKGYKKPPYAVPKVKPEDIESFFKQEKLSKELKTMLVLLFKYAFFIDYEQLKTICLYTGIDYNFLVMIKDYCMDYLDKKVKAQEKASEIRNRTYFLRKRTGYQISSIQKQLINSEKNSTLNYKLDSLNNKFYRQTERLEKDNSEIIKKYSHIVLKDKQIADFLGVCERQVRYYISNAKNNKIDLKKLKSLKKNLK